MHTYVPLPAGGKNGMVFMRIGRNDMRKAFRLILALAVMLTVVLSLGVCASADDLPREKVGFGFGMPEAAAVPAHDLTDDAVTLDGVSFNARIEDGKVYIRIVDLAAVNLLRENASAAEALGLDYAGLYIDRGLILVKADGKTADEIAAIEEKLAALKAQSAPIGVSVGDEYTLASGGADRLIIVVADLVYGSAAAEDASAPAPAPAEDKPVIDVVSKSTAAGSDKPADTTVYFFYGRGGRTYYLAEQNSANEGGEYSPAPNAADNASPSAGCSYDTDRIKYFDYKAGIVRGEGDTNDYYVFVDFGDGSEPAFVLVKTGDSYGEVEKNTGEHISVIRKASGTYSKDNPDQDKLAERILISTDGTMAGVVKTILINDATPAADKFFKENSNVPTDTPPEGYTKENGRKKYDNGYAYADGTKAKDTLYGYDYSVNDDDKIDIKDPTGETTTVGIRNNVTLVTDVDTKAPAPSAGAEETPVTQAADAPAEAETPVETETD